MQVDQVANSLEANLPMIKDDEKLRFAKLQIDKIDDPADRALATSFFIIGVRAAGKHELPMNVVLLVHGIRTQGVWQDRMAFELKKHPNVKPIIAGFDYVDILSFWLPGLFRRRPIEKIKRELRSAIYTHPEAKISVIAHSFGTYILSRILITDPDIKLFRVLLCGAIIPKDFPWDSLKSFPSGGVLNEVGTQDNLPALARSISWGYGNSGTFGFRTGMVDDRYFNFGHSDFFTEEHIRTFTVPFIVDGEIVDSAWNRDRPTPPWIFSIMHILPLKSVALPILALAVATSLWGAWRAGVYLYRALM